MKYANFGYAFNKPTHVTIDITYRCQLRCPTCTMWSSAPLHPRTELPSTEWKRIISRLKKWLGAYSLFFTGGEPLLRRDIFEIIDYAETGGVATGMVTNGYLLEDLFGDVITSRLSWLSVSLNGIMPHTHDASRGTRGTLEKVKAGIAKVNSLRKKRKKRLRLTIATIIMPSNYDEILPLLSWVKKEGLDGVHFQILEDRARIRPLSESNSLISLKKPSFRPVKGGIQLLTHLIRKKQQGVPIINSLEQLRAFKEHLEKPKRTFLRPCYGGTDRFSIDPFGKMSFCTDMRAIGKVTEEAPDTIWNSYKARQQRQAIKKCGKACRLMNCNFQ